MTPSRRIVAEYDVEDAKFRRGTDRTEQRLIRFERTTSRTLDRFDRRFERSARVIGGLRTAFVGVAGGLGIAHVGAHRGLLRGARLALAHALDGGIGDHLA